MEPSPKDPVYQLADRVREAAFALHKFLRHGHLEKVYEAGLANRLAREGIFVQRQVPLTVRDDDGTILGEFVADLLVEGCLVIELKACRALADEHTAQILGYLRATGIRHGMLINFGAPRLQVRMLAMTREGWTAEE